MRKRAVAVVAVMVAGGVAVAGPAEAAPKKPAKASDFNGDGRVDVAAGFPGKTLKKRKNAGAVVVLNGGKTLAKTGRTLSRDTAGVPDRSRSKEKFGETIVSADFNRDGYADLAVSATGQVVVLYGSKAGLTGKNSRVIKPGFAAREDGPGSRQGTPDGLRFGSVMSAGDYDGDGFGDLAVRSDRGTSGILVLKGGKKGLTTAGAKRITNGLLRFGTYLATGDVNNDKKADLIASQETSTGGAPSGTSWNQPFALVFGTSNGLDVRHRVSWQVKTFRQVHFTVGDLNGDGRADLARMKVMGEGDDLIYQLSRGGSFGPAQAKGLPADYFLTGPLRIGDLNGDGRGDLAVQINAWIYSWVNAYAGTPTGIGNQIGAYGGDTEAVSYGDHIFLGNVAGDKRADVTFTADSAYGGGNLVTAESGDPAKERYLIGSAEGLGYSLVED